MQVIAEGPVRGQIDVSLEDVNGLRTSAQAEADGTTVVSNLNTSALSEEDVAVKAQWVGPDGERSTLFTREMAHLERTSPYENFDYCWHGRNRHFRNGCCRRCRDV